VVDRGQVDDVGRGAKDADWQAAKDAARQIAHSEDRAIFDGDPAAGIRGVRASSSTPAITILVQVRKYPDAWVGVEAVGSVWRSSHLDGGPNRTPHPGRGPGYVTDVCVQVWPNSKAMTLMAEPRALSWWASSSGAGSPGA
jgi:Encapsulating protein for peroxidase